MELEGYFEFIGEGAIRIAGTRVGIETVLRDGPRTRDMGGVASTQELGRAIADAL